MTDDLHDRRHRVLRELHEDGRASFSRIAEAVDIPRRLVTDIVRSALERDELRLAVSLSPELLGTERFAYLQIAVDGPVAPVRDALAAMRETTFVADVAGRFPLDAEIRVGRDPHLRQTLDRIAQLPGVRDLRTHLYENIEINVYSPLRTDRASVRIDATDRAIILTLQGDPRASFRTIGEAVGLSPSGARVRVERMLRHRAIKIVGIPVRGAQPENPSLGVGIRSRGAIADVLPHLRELNPEFLAITIGEYDIIATLSADTPAELIDTVDALRQLPQITAAECWANLRIVKEQYGLPFPRA